MDRSQENAIHSSTKAQSTDAGIANASQQVSHEIGKGASFRGPLTLFPQESMLENNSEMSSAEKLGGRKSEQFLSSIAAQYFQPVAGAGKRVLVFTFNNLLCEFERNQRQQAVFLSFERTSTCLAEYYIFKA